MSRPTCAGCHAIIRWLKTTAGKAMPIDPEKLQEWVTDTARQTAPKITLVTTDGRMETGWQASVITPGSRSIEGYVPHFATCPKAKDFKR
jgi:hypothetical protein